MVTLIVSLLSKWSTLTVPPLARWAGMLQMLAYHPHLRSPRLEPKGAGVGPRCCSSSGQWPMAVGRIRHGEVMSHMEGPVGDPSVPEWTRGNAPSQFRPGCQDPPQIQAKTMPNRSN